MDARTLVVPGVATVAAADFDAVIVVDVERDFCPPIDDGTGPIGGALAVEGGDIVAARISAWLDGTDILVAATADHHPPTLPGHFAPAGIDPDYATTWPAHCVAGTRGVEWHPALRLPAQTVVFRKGQRAAAYSGFESPDDLVGWLRHRGVRRVGVVGIALDHCVVATALDAAANGFAVTVVVDLTAAVAEASAVDAMARLGAADVVLGAALAS